MTIFLVCFSQGSYAGNNRPFWTERSSYVEGDTLYSVGVASKSKSQEEGRQTAYENGKRELGNFAQITDLSGLTIETQMTYEEQNLDGSFNVFRLVKVDMDALTKWKTRLLARATAELEKQNFEVTKEVVKKKREIENLERQTSDLAALDARAAAIIGQIKNMKDNVSKYIRCGMHMNEVRSLLGEPRAINNYFALINLVSWNYGEQWLAFQNGILVGVDRDSNPVERSGCYGLDRGLK